MEFGFATDGMMSVAEHARVDQPKVLALVVLVLVLAGCQTRSTAPMDLIAEARSGVGAKRARVLRSVDTVGESTTVVEMLGNTGNEGGSVFVVKGPVKIHLEWVNYRPAPLLKIYYRPVRDPDTGDDLTLTPEMPGAWNGSLVQYIRECP